ncbi:hypothetical protein ACFQ34_13000 [Pseudonocardia benzenivorans]|jgi:hypothetical protein|uniref:Uncharacterized protein n=2 Tax=Pseudonocardia TaxID=1847 RepID=F4CUC9_PSEUX|nr:hypothetical protein [Pseudonocardia dioxanivorans]AEA24588.1 hypothetical protein Psed_2383 [Pseudonocardia dioxanivorans CB1190]GJF04704.1 hypothetical protein PSD17_36580 [Pseudonocardia sp. D17]
MTATDRDGYDEQPEATPREVFIRLLLDTVRDDPYPSGTQLDMIEQSIPPDMVPEYVELLAQKSREGAFPSTDVLRRMQRMSGG